MIRRVFAVASSVALMTLSTPAAERVNLSGTWVVSASAIEGQSPNGRTWRRSAIKTEMVLEQAGDTLRGSWTGLKGEVWRLSGRVQDNAFEVESETRELRGAGNESASFRWRIRGSLEGDHMKGTLYFEREDDDELRPQPFTATRRPS